MQLNKSSIIGGAVILVLIVAIAAAIMFRPASDSWKAAQKSVYPQFVRVDHKNLAPIVTRPFSDEIDIAFVIDKNDSYDFIMKAQMRDWAVSDRQIYDVAMENLEEKAEETNIELAEASKLEQGKYAIIETGDGYDAVRLLSETVRSKIAASMGENYVAAIPLRDFLIFWSADFALQNDFISQVQEEFDGAGTYRLTPNPFLVTPEGIQPLKAQTGAGM